ncbi:hypothetical protein ACS0TY_004712 [Phlomoides rotata]
MAVRGGGNARGQRREGNTGYDARSGAVMRVSGAVEDFRLKILVTDALIFTSPNYNYSVSGPLKNALDWGSRSPNDWANKTAAVVSAAGGSKGQQSHYHLRQIGFFSSIFISLTSQSSSLMCTNLPIKRSIAMQNGLPILGVFRFGEIWMILPSVA